MKGVIISNQKQMHTVILSCIRRCKSFDDLFKLLTEIYSELYTSQDHMNKVWVKVERYTCIDPEEMHWDFQTAKQYMDDNNLEYLETGNSKECDCIKNLLLQSVSVALCNL
eukprot:14629500-Ditylum_brightwellii.AAC.1